MQNADYDDLTPPRPAAELDAFFLPRSVALIGATDRPGSVGLALFNNLRRFGGTLHLVNPYKRKVDGIRTVRTIGKVKDQVDLAVIATPAETVPGIVQACAQAGVRAASIIAAGLTASQTDEIRRARGTMRVIGPNAMGIARPALNLDATFAQVPPRAGRVAFLTQSGALGAALLSKSAEENMGFSAFASIGDMVDVSWSDLLFYFGSDDKTRSIIIYMESIGDARAFMSAAREVALDKPIIVIRGGRTPAGARAAEVHTGAQVGNGEVIDAALRRCGVLSVSTIVDAFYIAEMLEKQPIPGGRKLMIISNAGGPGVLAADALAASGGVLADLFPREVSALNDVLPPYWSHTNPVFLGVNADADRYGDALNVIARQSFTDGILVIMTPQGMTDPVETAHRVRGFAKIGKTMLACWMGGDEVEEGVKVLNEADIPTFAYPDTAARVFSYLWQYRRGIEALYETPVPTADPFALIEAHGMASVVIGQAQAEDRTELTPLEVDALLAAYDMPPEFASPDDGLMRIRLSSTIDPQFGPVIVFGPGGLYRDLKRAQVVGLPPLNMTLARRMVEGTIWVEALTAAFGKDSLMIIELLRLVVALSQLIVDQPAVRETDIELVVGQDGSIGTADASITLGENGEHRTAIRPYPRQYVTRGQTKDSTPLVFRPIRPEDEPDMVAFQRTLSARSVGMRYFSEIDLVRRTGHEWLSRSVFIDYDREIRLVAEVDDNGVPVIVATGQIVKLWDGEAEYALVVSDEMQGQGIGTQMLTRLIEIAAAEGCTAVIGYVLYSNQGMLAVCKRLGFTTQRTIDPQVVLVRLPLTEQGEQAQASDETS